MKNYLIVLFVALLLGGPVWAGEAVVGTVTHLSGTFSVQRLDGSAKVLAVKSDVLEGDLLSTEAETYARIKFVDGGEVVLRPSSQFKVEKYSYNEADASQDNVVLGLLKGGLRAVTGLIGKRSRDKVAYGTPVATIGIRGTNFGALFCNSDCGGIQTSTGTSPANGLHVDVSSGAIVLVNPAGTQNFAAGQFGYVPNRLSPPIVVPPAQGIQVTMPTAIAANGVQGPNPGGGLDSNKAFCN